MTTIAARNAAPLTAWTPTFAMSEDVLANG